MLLFAQAGGAAGDDQSKLMQEASQRLATHPSNIIGTILTLGCVVCSIIVIVRMFQKEYTTLGILAIVGHLCCCPGMLITFIMGWVKSGDWKIMPVMLIWTVLFLALIGDGIWYNMQLQEVMKELQQEHQKNLPAGLLMMW